MVGAHVLGNDAAISIGALNGNLDLNVMMPVIAYNLLESIELFGNVCHVFAEKCVQGIQPNRERCLAYAERSSALVTALAPLVGYDRAAQIGKQSLAEDKPIRQAILEAGVIPPEKVEELLDLKKMTGNAG
jgi:fumarate hydratase class II